MLSTYYNPADVPNKIPESSLVSDKYTVHYENRKLFSLREVQIYSFERSSHNL